MAGHSNHAANAAAWAAMREAQAADAARLRERRRAEREARREANRAAWWARLGLEAPQAIEAGPEPVEQQERAEEPEALEVRRCRVEQASPSEWHITTPDGAGYSIEANGYTVDLGNGEAYTVPTLEAAREMVELAEETRRDEADAAGRFSDGMRLESNGVTYTVDHATPTRVTLRIDAAGASKVQKLMVRRSARGQFVKLHAGHKGERAIYAADLAA